MSQEEEVFPRPGQTAAESLHQVAANVSLEKLFVIDENILFHQRGRCRGRCGEWQQDGQPGPGHAALCQHVEEGVRGAQLGGHGGPAPVPDEELQVVQECGQTCRGKSRRGAEDDQETAIAVRAR